MSLRLFCRVHCFVFGFESVVAHLLAFLLLLHYESLKTFPKFQSAIRSHPLDSIFGLFVVERSLRLYSFDVALSTLLAAGLSSVKSRESTLHREF